MDSENAELASCTEWTCVSADKRKAVGFTFQPLVTPNAPDSYYRPSGLNEEYKYHFYNRELKYDIRDFGDLVNTVSPVHIRQDSFLHNMAAKFVKMNGETEDYTAYGDTLMYAGVRLKQNFCGTGFNENVRFYQDFAARMYFMEAVD
jgi:alpha-galactosidase